MATDPHAWHEAHELAALERLFEIGLHAIRERRAIGAVRAVRLATRATSTREEFESALRSVAEFTPTYIAAEVAHVYRMVAERATR